MTDTRVEFFVQKRVGLAKQPDEHVPRLNLESYRSYPTFKFVHEFPKNSRWIKIHVNPKIPLARWIVLAPQTIFERKFYLLVAYM